MPAQLRTTNYELLTQRGFSLVELLIALVLITITAVIFTKATDTLGRISQASHQTTAFHIAARKLESLRGGQFASISSACPFTDSELSKLPRGSACLTVTEEPATSGKVKKAEAEVSWFEQSAAKEVKITTLISEYGLHK